MPRDGDQMTSKTVRSAEVPRPRCVSWVGPFADRTCSLTRVVECAGLRLAVWTCTDPVRYVNVKFKAYRFPTGRARKWWPGCSSAWYDAFYGEDGDCYPGRTQYVVYRGGRRRSS
jgi:hypothetical protein